MSSVLKYCYGTERKIAVMSSMGIATMPDLFECIADDVAGYARDFPSAGGVYKRHVINFFNRKCRGVYVDFEKMIRDRVIQIGGVYPDQWMVLASSRLLTPQREKQISLHSYNGVEDDEQALQLALRNSLETSKMRPISKLPQMISKLPQMVKQPIFVQAAVPASQVTVCQEDQQDEPDELCCPLSLVLFVDPVQTIRGTTYERAFIAKWFEYHRSDPLTGEALNTTVLYDNVDMRQRCDAFRCKG